MEFTDDISYTTADTLPFFLILIHFKLQEQLYIQR